MEFRNQALLLKKTRVKAEKTQKEMSELLGLKDVSGVVYVSQVELGKSGMSPDRWRRIEKLVPWNQALAACQADFKDRWLKEYEDRRSKKASRTK